MVARSDMTPEDVAKALGVTRKAVLSWIKSKELGAWDARASGSRIPRWKISAENVERFLAQRSAGVPELPDPRASTLNKLPRLAGLLERQIAREEARERRAPA